MIKHLFKLMWNKRKQNFLLMIEMLFSFLTLFVVFSLIVYYYRNYKKPMGFDFEQVWVVEYHNALKTAPTDSLNRFYQTLRKTIQTLPEVRSAGYSAFNYPFSNGISEMGMTYEHQQIWHVNSYWVDENYKDVLRPTVVEGRWFNQTDMFGSNPMVINATLKKTFFGNGPAVGKRLQDRVVIGVVQDMKTGGDYVKVNPSVYSPLDTASFRWLNILLVRVAPGADAAFEGRLYKTITGVMKNSEVNIEHLSDNRIFVNRFNLAPLIVVIGVAVFLIINVALGLFGALWYNISKRRGEIGLRRAIGASGRSVSAQLVAEAMVLATFSLIVGVFFAIQVPLLNLFNVGTGVYVTAMVLDILFIYLLVLICSLYPGRQAAGIQPAVALHED